MLITFKVEGRGRGRGQRRRQRPLEGEEPSLLFFRRIENNQMIYSRQRLHSTHTDR